MSRICNRSYYGYCSVTKYAGLTLQYPKALNSGNYPIRSLWVPNRQLCLYLTFVHENVKIITLEKPPESRLYEVVYNNLTSQLGTPLILACILSQVS